MGKEDTIREKQKKGNIKNINKMLILVTLLQWRGIRGVKKIGVKRKTSKILQQFTETKKTLTFTQKNEGRRRFGRKNKHTYFVLLSTCTTFAVTILNRNDYILQ